MLLIQKIQICLFLPRHHWNFHHIHLAPLQQLPEAECHSISFGNHSSAWSSSELSMAFEMAHRRKQVRMVSSGTPSQAWLTQVITSCLVGWVRLPAAAKGRGCRIHCTHWSQTRSLKGLAMPMLTGWASPLQPGGTNTTSTCLSFNAWRIWGVWCAL